MISVNLGADCQVDRGRVPPAPSRRDACGALALRAAAGFLLRRPAWGVAEYLAELRGRGIAALDEVATVLGLSLDRLARVLYRCQG